MGSKLSKPVSTPVHAPGPLTTFPLFRKLPVEIRRMIWKHSLPGERFLEFVSEYEPADWIVFFIQCKDKKIPHMSACHESRAVAREEYVEFRPYVTGCPPMYVSPKLDIFCFAGRCFEDLDQVLVQARDQISIKRVATQYGFGPEFPAKDCRAKYFPKSFYSRVY
jgi:2EXR family